MDTQRKIEGPHFVRSRLNDGLDNLVPIQKLDRPELRTPQATFVVYFFKIERVVMNTLIEIKQANTVFALNKFADVRCWKTFYLAIL